MVPLQAGWFHSVPHPPHISWLNTLVRESGEGQEWGREAGLPHHQFWGCTWHQRSPYCCGLSPMQPGHSVSFMSNYFFVNICLLWSWWQKMSYIPVRKCHLNWIVIKNNLSQSFISKFSLPLFHTHTRTEWQDQSTCQHGLRNILPGYTKRRFMGNKQLL